MKPKRIWTNLTVSDLERTTRFYETLGFRLNGTPNEQLTSFLFGDDNSIIHFFRKEVLQSNVDIDISDAHKANEVIFTLSAESRAEVDDWADEVRKAGGKIVSKPAPGEGFYGFVFADPDGHKFNVFYM